MHIKELASAAREFDQLLTAQKKELAPQEFDWYPYGTLSNFHHLKVLLEKACPDVLSLAGDQPMVDIGAADGDTAFFLESLGYHVDTVDYPPTNFNGCRGLKRLKQARQSNVGLHEVDLDRHFELPGKDYGLAFFLGILYHLKNPYAALESLAKMAHHALISTRIARYNVAKEHKGRDGLNNERMKWADVPAAYLVAPLETNNDPTNYWMFTEAGLKRILDRCGWDLMAWATLGDTRQSDPATAEHDERAFCLVRSRVAERE